MRTHTHILTNFLDRKWFLYFLFYFLFLFSRFLQYIEELFIFGAPKKAATKTIKLNLGVDTVVEYIIGLSGLLSFLLFRIYFHFYCREFIKTKFLFYRFLCRFVSVLFVKEIPL